MVGPFQKHLVGAVGIEFTATLTSPTVSRRCNRPTKTIGTTSTNFPTDADSARFRESFRAHQTDSPLLAWYFLSALRGAEFRVFPIPHVIMLLAYEK